MKKMYKLVYYSAIVVILFTGSCKKDEQAPAPTINSFSPSSGAVGSQVTISGSNFSTTPSNNKVFFNGAPAKLVPNTNGPLIVEVPGGGSTGKISIQVGTQTATSADDFTYLAPVINSFSPVYGNVGAHIRIEGDNFSINTADNIVKFNGVQATFYDSGIPNQSSTLWVTVPPNVHSGKITVQIGSMTATSSYEFIYTPPVTVGTLAGTGVAGYADGSTAQFNGPAGLAIDGSGNIYVADSKNNVIRIISPNGTAGLWAGNLTAGFADGSSTTARFSNPTGLAIDAAGNLYVADTDNHRIRKIDTNGSVTTVAGNGTAGMVDGATSTAQFNHPSDVAVDQSGNIYVSDLYNYRIRKITAGGQVSTLAGNGSSGFADGSGSSAQFSFVRGITTDGAGNIYAADLGNERIRKITPAGIVSTFAYPGDGDSFLSRPYDAVFDKEGYLLFTDFSIGKIPPSGYLYNSYCIIAPDSNESFQRPQGIVIDKNGVIYFSDFYDNRIRKITSQ